MTNEKRPRVKILIGRVRINTSGLIKILISAKTTAKTIAPTKVTSTPGKRYALIMIAIVATNQCVKFIPFEIGSAFYTLTIDYFL